MSCAILSLLYTCERTGGDISASGHRLEPPSPRTSRESAKCPGKETLQFPASEGRSDQGRQVARLFSDMTPRDATCARTRCKHSPACFPDSVAPCLARPPHLMLSPTFACYMVPIYYSSRYFEPLPQFLHSLLDYLYHMSVERIFFVPAGAVLLHQEAESEKGFTGEVARQSSKIFSLESSPSCVLHLVGTGWQMLHSRESLAPTTFC
ncbi:hypothetical protein Mapa_001188 [Marchantia paleacea]|nr:hypothetical protein Mapa_001188 [Marchantia paleacea]